MIIKLKKDYNFEIKELNDDKLKKIKKIKIEKKTKKGNKRNWWKKLDKEIQNNINQIKTTDIKNKDIFDKIKKQKLLKIMKKNINEENNKNNVFNENEYDTIKKDNKLNEENIGIKKEINNEI